MNTDQLKQVIWETLSPIAETRRTAEEALTKAQATPGHPVEVLRLVTSADGDENVPLRQAAVVLFKNLVKKGWDTSDADKDTEGIIFSHDDRSTIKSHLVQLMCTTPPHIQVQLSESISLIAAVDFPDQWQNLLPELVQHFQTSNPDVLVGVLKTANSICRSFRDVDRSDDLYRVILYTLNGIQEPLLALFVSLGQSIESCSSDASKLRPRFEALLLVCRLFYSLNFQDLPEFFEDHISDWMTGFAKYLQYQNPVVMDASEEVEPSPIDKVQASIIHNLNLYASKDEEPFMEYLPNFTSLVWNLLMNVSSYPKHDVLAITSIRFLSSLIEKPIHRTLFQDTATLQQIVGKIVIPNLMFRESDEERFEEDPREYIATEVEGNDSQTRRKCSQDLLRAMCRQFEKETALICIEHIQTMLVQFASDPNGQWKAKDAAIHLMMGIAIRRKSSLGVSEIIDSVNLLSFFSSNILPELQDQNHLHRPVIKATSIKFVSIFRNQFNRDHLVQLMPLLINHLGSPIVVVHTCAAYAIERMIISREIVNEMKQPKLIASDLQPMLEPLFNGLFSIIDSVAQNENDYVMKCVMRTLAAIGEDVVPVTPIVITKLTSALGRVAKNPRNPQFNHYLFESIAVLVRSVCSKDPGQTTALEPLLFEPFNVILQMQIAEFTPYVFQVLAQLLEYRPVGSGLGPAYTSLFLPILTPVLWEQKGNVPALTRLLQAYIRKTSDELIEHLDCILGVFQKLVSVKSTEACAFDLLTIITVHFRLDAMESKYPTVFQILLFRLQANSKAPRYRRLVTTYFSLFVGKYGPEAFVKRLDSMQDGLAIMIIFQIWSPQLLSDLPSIRREAKVSIIGLTKLLCESSLLLSDPDRQVAWSGMLAAVVAMLTSSSWKASSCFTTSDKDVENEEIGYDAQFSKLSFASRPLEDYFPEVPDARLFFCQSLCRLVSTSQPGLIHPLIQNGLSVDPKLSAGLESMLQQAGLELS